MPTMNLRVIKKILLVFIVYSSYVTSVWSGPTINGLEWRQVTETSTISWNEVSTVCNQSTGVCNGSIETVDFTGWTWASVDEVTDLFNAILPGTANDLTKGGDTINETNSQLPASFFTVFEPTYIDSNVQAIFGWSRDKNTNSMPLDPSVSNQFDPNGVDVITTQNSGSASIKSPGVGSWLYRASGSPVAINYGLFIGAFDPESRFNFLNFVDFRKNARTMAAAFAARPNTIAYTLTGDLSLKSNGEAVSPITGTMIRQKLQQIRAKMRAGDMLTLYINNHGGSILPKSGGGYDVTDTGEGDEVIYVGDFLRDNLLADLLYTFDGFRIQVFLDSCHGGGFWGGSDVKEIPPSGVGYNDLNQLNNIALYSGAAEDKLEYSFSSSFSFWGKALLEAFKTPVSWSPGGLASFLNQRTLQIASVGAQEAPVWYTLALGDIAFPDVDLIETFVANSADFNMSEVSLSGPEPVSQLSNLASSVTGIGPGKSLLNKVTFAQANYEVGDIVATCEYLNAFINQVNAQTGKKVPTELAEGFVASAEFTMSAIGCN